VVPKWNLIDDFVESLGLAAGAVLPQVRVDQGPTRRTEPPRRTERTPPRADRAVPSVLWFPRIDDDPPLGPSPDNPMGEGSEETALPVIDPVDVRLGRTRSAPEPLP
jgi:hypothetical protein